MGNFQNLGKLCLQLYVIMVLVNKISTAAIAHDSSTESSSSNPNDDSSTSHKPIDYSNRPLIPPATVSANIAQFSPSMSTPRQRQQGSIIIR